MSSSDDSGGVQERTTAEMLSVLLKADNEGEVARGSGSSTDNVVNGSILGELVLGVLRSRSSKDERRERDGDDGLETHDDSFE